MTIEISLPLFIMWLVFGLVLSGMNLSNWVIIIPVIAIVFKGSSFNKSPFVKAPMAERKAAIIAYGISPKKSAIGLLIGVFSFLVFYFLVLDKNFWASVCFAFAINTLVATIYMAKHLRNLDNLSP